MIDDETAFAGRDKTAVVGIGQTALTREFLAAACSPSRPRRLWRRWLMQD